MVSESEQNHNNYHRPRKSFGKDVLRALLVVGATVLVLSNPYAATRFLREIRRGISQKKLRNSFYYLCKRGLVHYEEAEGQIFLSLTEKGKKIASRYDFFEKGKIKNSSVWDGQWRLVLFDIATEHRTKRNALRFLLKRLGFVQFQKSVWLIPYNCGKEIDDLKKFFNLTDSEVRLALSRNMGDMSKYKKIFQLSA